MATGVAQLGRDHLVDHGRAMRLGQPGIGRRLHVGDVGGDVEVRRAAFALGLHALDQALARVEHIDLDPTPGREGVEDRLNQFGLA